MASKGLGWVASHATVSWRIEASRLEMRGVYKEREMRTATRNNRRKSPAGKRVEGPRLCCGFSLKSQRVALVATSIAKPPTSASVFVKTGKIHPVWFSQFFSKHAYLNSMI
jgi:hypothetical protein